MKKSLIVLSVLLVLAIIALPVINYMKRDRLTEKKDFAIPDTETIDSIFLANKEGDYVLLRKQPDNSWTVNNAFKAAPDKIALLLKTMNKLEAKNPVAQTAQQTVVNDIAVGGIKVEVYQRGEKTKTYYVGGSTADEMGTFMYIDGSTIPFVVHIPGFRGYLTSRYTVSARDWRDKGIFDTPVDKLHSVAVTYPDDAASSFELVKGEGNTFTVSRQGQPAPATKQEFAKLYAAQFATLTFEAYMEGYSKNYVDSLHSATPKAIISITRTDGNKATLKVYYKPVTADTKSLYDEKGNLLVYDSDNYLALIEGSPELITVQDYLFRNVFRKYSDFVKE